MTPTVIVDFVHLIFTLILCPKSTSLQVSHLWIYRYSTHTPYITQYTHTPHITQCTHTHITCDTVSDPSSPGSRLHLHTGRTESFHQIASLFASPQGPRRQDLNTQGPHAAGSTQPLSSGHAPHRTAQRPSPACCLLLSLLQVWNLAQGPWQPAALSAFASPPLT